MTPDDRCTFDGSRRTRLNDDDPHTTTWQCPVCGITREPNPLDGVQRSFDRD